LGVTKITQGGSMQGFAAVDEKLAEAHRKLVRLSAIQRVPDFYDALNDFLAAARSVESILAFQFCSMIWHTHRKAARFVGNLRKLHPPSANASIFGRGQKESPFVSIS
jgi:hypothetical protein